MKYDCEIIRDLLPLYAEEIASPASTAMVRAHLEECPDCARLLAQMQRPVPVRAETKQHCLQLNFSECIHTMLSREAGKLKWSMLMKQELAA